MNTSLTKLAVATHLARTDLEAWLERRADRDLERGSHTTDVILWALAIITIVGIAVLFLTGYVNKIGAQLLAS